MKKLYFLNEEEKNRILNLHESATKRQYLGEAPLGPVKVPEVGPKTEGVSRDVNWTGIYACVPKAKGAVATTLSDKSKAYILNGYVYYNNGFKRKQPVANNKSEKYTCNDPEFKTGVSNEDKAKKQQEYKQQVVTKTTDTTKQIQKLLGLTETGVMDSGLLQKINDKLNGGGTSSTPAAASSTPAAASTPAYNFNIDPNIGKDGINFNQMTPEQIAQGVQSATPPQETIAATTPLTNKEKRQQRRDLRAKQRGNQ